VNETNLLIELNNFFSFEMTQNIKINKDVFVC